MMVVLEVQWPLTWIYLLTQELFLPSLYQMLANIHVPKSSPLVLKVCPHNIDLDYRT